MMIIGASCEAIRDHVVADATGAGVHSVRRPQSGLERQAWMFSIISGVSGVHPRRRHLLGVKPEIKDIASR